MIITEYSDKYHLDVARLVENFHKESVGEYAGLFDKDAVINSITSLKDSNSAMAFLLVADGVCHGILAGIAYKSMVNNKMIFQEIIWYVNGPYRRYGVRLLNEVQKRLKNRGFEIMIMAVMENSKTDKVKGLYERLGFKPMEVHYVRDL